MRHPSVYDTLGLSYWTSQGQEAWRISTEEDGIVGIGFVLLKCLFLISAVYLCFKIWFTLQFFFGSCIPLIFTLQFVFGSYYLVYRLSDLATMCLFPFDLYPFDKLLICDHPSIRFNS